MKNFFLGMLFLVMGTVVVAQQPDQRGYIVKVGEQVPEFEMTLMDGSKVKMSELRGKVVMLQFTASWCGVCRKEMPFIEKEIWQVHKNKDFALFGLDRDEPREKAQKLIDATKITYPIALDKGAGIFTKFAHKKSGVTRNVIVDRDGKIVFMTRLYEREEFNQMKKVIEKLLQNK
ncbi:MAG: TlpA family protein disulfide reductase [Marinifilaceae bacterium]